MNERQRIMNEELYSANPEIYFSPLKEFLLQFKDDYDVDTDDVFKSIRFYGKQIMPTEDERKTYGFFVQTRIVNYHTYDAVTHYGYIPELTDIRLLFNYYVIQTELFGEECDPYVKDDYGCFHYLLDEENLDLSKPTGEFIDFVVMDEKQLDGNLAARAAIVRHDYPSDEIQKIVRQETGIVLDENMEVVEY